jgi:hypothetical protein
MSADEKLNAVLFHLAEPAVLQWHVCSGERIQLRPGHVQGCVSSKIAR